MEAIYHGPAEPGRGLIRPVFSIEVVKGDMIRVPRGTHHWFDLRAERTIRAIRLFQDVSGWTPHYTGSRTDANYQPLCFGPMYIPARGV
jgi:1,2-dihydroxy-3-keto-5-methylthiopentene dioxygenase